MQEILTYIQGMNPNILLGLAALTGTFYMFQNFIGKIFKKIKDTFNHIFFYQIDIHYSTESYHKFNKWFVQNNKNIKFMRNYKIEKNDGEEKIIPGYGNSYFFIKGKPLIIVERSKEEKKNIYTETDLIKVKVFTIFRKKMIRLFNEIEQIKLYEKGQFIPHIYKAHDDWWSKTAPLRDVLEPSAKGSKMLINDIQSFLDKKELYKDKKIPFKRGYLLYGPPGTGKSSMVLYAANKFKRNVYVVDRPLNESLLSEIQEDSILLIEDIDLSIMTPIKRKLNSSKPDQNVDEQIKDDDDVYEQMTGGEMLRKTLNMLDGIYSYDNAIFICTTNKKDALDDAMIRPGRIDKAICIDLLSPSEQLEFFNTFFKSNYRQIDYKNTRTVAELSAVLVENIEDEDKARSILNIS